MPATDIDDNIPAVSRDEMRKILAGLLSPHSDFRLQAQADLKALGPAAVDLLLAEAELQTAEWMKRKRRYKWIAGVYLSIAIPGIIYCIGGSIYYYNHGFPDMVGALMGGGVGGLGGGLGGGVLGGFASLLVPPRELVAISNALLSFDDPKVIGALVAGLSVPDPRLRIAVHDKLLTLLPQASAADLAEVTATQRQPLRKLLSLNPENDSQLIIAVIEAFERMGDTSALPEVRRLAASQGTTQKTRSVRDAAEHCMKSLHALLGQGVDHLLRASENPGPEGGELLRPAGFSGSGDEQTLLRPTGVEDGHSSYGAESEETVLEARSR
jgi:hypothetical protein